MVFVTVVTRASYDVLLSALLVVSTHPLLLLVLAVYM
jgi:hypothetical protein